MDKLKESLQAKRFLNAGEINLERLMNFNKRKYVEFYKLVNESCEYLKKYDDTLENNIIVQGDYNSSNNDLEINFTSKNKKINHNDYYTMGLKFLEKGYLIVHFSSKEMMKYQKEVIKNYKKYLEEIKNLIEEKSLRESALIWVPDKTNQFLLKLY